MYFYKQRKVCIFLIKNCLSKQKKVEKKNDFRSLELFLKTHKPKKKNYFVEKRKEVEKKISQARND
jgi:hypothetical protein